MSTHAPRAVPALDTPVQDSPALDSPALDSPALESPASPVMAMLSDHLPLTLLLDLALGVRSNEVYDAEPPDLAWLSAAAVSRAS